MKHESQCLHGRRVFLLAAYIDKRYNFNHSYVTCVDVVVVVLWLLLLLLLLLLVFVGCGCRDVRGARVGGAVAALLFVAAG